MNKIASIIVTALLASVVALPDTAIAFPLSKPNAELLCVPSASGDKYVLPDRLYGQILKDAGLPFFQFGEVTDYAASVFDKTFPQDKPGDDEVTVKRNASVREAKTKVLTNMTDLVDENEFGISGFRFRRMSAAHEDKFAFRPVQVAGSTFAAVISNPDDINAPMVVFCEPPEDEDRPDDVADKEPSFLDGFRLRKNLDELSIATFSPTNQTADELKKERKKAKLATFSILDDRENDARTVSLEGVVGYRLGNWMPFIGFKSEDQAGQDNDIQVLTGGLQFDYLTTWDNAPFQFYTKGQGYGVLDEENEAENIKFRITTSPSGNLMEDFRIGAENKTLGGFIYRPLVSLIGEGTLMTDKGSNAIFNRTDDYWGLGGSIDLQIRNNQVDGLKNFNLNAGYRYLRVLSNEDLNIRTFNTSLEWAPGEDALFGVSLTYDKGEHAETFQDQDIVKVNLGVKY